jgi:hypothetical protein
MVNIKTDYVIQLITGKFDEKGRFVPFKLNPYTSITELIRSSDKSMHEIMVKENLWPGQVSLDRKVFSKTKAEKLEFKTIAAAHAKQMIAGGFNPKKRLNLTDPLTITL